mmetsp:Transcript_112687/g.313468  ORF Transcript_112687/g.313468 Transcript_112687/m.313468 type:complete len:200 (+) Transcript_112687:2783-3382(+)
MDLSALALFTSDHHRAINDEGFFKIYAPCKIDERDSVGRGTAYGSSELRSAGHNPLWPSGCKLSACSPIRGSLLISHNVVDEKRTRVGGSTASRRWALPQIAPYVCPHAVLGDDCGSTPCGLNKHAASTIPQDGVGHNAALPIRAHHNARAPVPCDSVPADEWVGTGLEPDATSAARDVTSGYQATSTSTKGDASAGVA